MSGVDIVGALLRADAALLAKVPADRIREGLLQDGVELPAIVVSEISSSERQTLRRGGTVRTTDRVAVTLRAASARDRKLIIGLIAKACAGRTGSVGGGSSVSILTAGRGPDLNGPANSFEKTQDFRVSYDAAT